MSYVTIQDWMLAYGLSMRETVLYAVIYGFSQDGESKCYATQDYLCGWLQCSTPTLHKALNGLLERGLIIKEQPNAFGKCTYAAVGRGKETLPQYKETLSQQYKETLPNNKGIDIKIDSNINGGKPDYEQEFASIWEKYPRKEGRQRAQVAYIAARRKGISAEIIRDGVIRYAEQVKAEQTPPQYIKQGGNWFAAHRWEDQHTTQRTTPANRALNFLHSEFHYTEDELRKRGLIEDFAE